MAHAGPCCNISSDTTNCHIPMPPTGEEDATQASTTQAKSPMNICMHKIAETACLNKDFELKHAHMQLIIIHNGNQQHSDMHAFNMFIIFISRNYDCRSKMDNITYLMMNSICNQLRRCNVPHNHRPVCSLISK